MGRNGVVGGGDGHNGVVGGGDSRNGIVGSGDGRNGVVTTTTKFIEYLLVTVAMASS